MKTHTIRLNSHHNWEIIEDGNLFHPVDGRQYSLKSQAEAALAEIEAVTDSGNAPRVTTFAKLSNQHTFSRLTKENPKEHTYFRKSGKAACYVNINGDKISNFFLFPSDEKIIDQGE